MTFRTLSAHVHELHAAAKRLPPIEDAKTRIGALAFSRYGEAAVRAMPAVLNVAGLALAMPRLCVHELRAPVPRLVAETDLHALPSEPPRLLRGGAVLVEVRDPATESIIEASPFPAWERTVGLGAYLQPDGLWFIVGLGHPDGIIVSLWRPAWGEADVSAGVLPAPADKTDAIVGDVEGYDEWGRDAARTLVVLGLLLDAAETPLRTADEGPQLAGRAHGKPRPARPWAVQRVYLAPSPRSAGEGAVEPGAAPREGLELEEVSVRGFLRRQPYGPGNRERRWIYVAEHAARRWVAPRPRRVVVGLTPRTRRR